MASASQALQNGFRIGECRIEPHQNRIVRADGEARLEPRVMDVLVCLAEHAGEVVSRDTLNARVWRNVVVTDQAVTNCISELRHHLGDDRSSARIIETIPKRGYRLTAPVHFETAPAEPNEAAASKPGTRWIVPAALLSASLLLGAVWWWNGTAAPVHSSIAVLQFENAAGDEQLDYLGLALPDEIATLLTKSRDLAVRPIGYLDANDPFAAARARRVDHIVSGRYYLEDDRRLSLAIEAQHVEEERVVWRTRITVPADDLLAMRGRLAEGIRHGLLPALGASAGTASGSMPANDEAYRLYLRSLALPKQPRPTERAIELLERVVALEPDFALAWFALGLRYYDHGTYGLGAEPARQKSLAAHRKALELDPGLHPAAREIVTHLTETGQMADAYAQARQLLERFGSNAETHFAISYVYRYGGLLEESQRHCEIAIGRDPQDPRLRSCAYAYLYAGELPRVMPFVALDEGSYFVQWATVLYHLRRDDRNAALSVTRQVADDATRRLMEPCLEGASGASLDEPVADFVRQWAHNGDPEALYAVAPILSYCGRSQEALRFVESGIDHGFCSFPALDLDPVWTKLRSDPEFQRVRAKAIACRDRFRRVVEAYGAETGEGSGSGNLTLPSTH